MRAINFLDPNDKLSYLERLIGMGLVGFLGTGIVSLVIALLTKDLTVGIYTTFVIGALLIPNHRFAIDRAVLLRNFHRWWNWHTGIIAMLLVVFFGVLFQTLLYDAQGFPQGTLKGWGDIAYHMDMIGRIAHADPFAIDQPVASGAPLTYPFLINYFSGMLMNLGWSLTWAWYVPSIVFSLTFFYGVHALAKRLLKSQVWAIAAIVLVIFGSGLGTVYFFQDVGKSFQQDGWLGVSDVLTDPPYQYTHMDVQTGGKPEIQNVPRNIVWITPVVSFFSHQRSFVLGASIFIFILLGWLVYDREPPANSKWVFSRWIVLLAVLPLAHAHTSIAAAMFFGVLFLEKVYKRETVIWWLKGGLLALLLAIIPLSYIFQHKITGDDTVGSQFKLWLGWMTCQHAESWIACTPNIPDTDASVWWFWTKNFGIIFWGWIAALGVLASVKSTRKNLLVLLAVPSVLLFVVPNIMLFQPWEFDNNKVLFYWWLLAILVMLGVMQMIPKRKFRIAALGIVVALGSIAGFVDTSTRVRQTVAAMQDKPILDHAGYYGATEIEAADWIKRNSEPNDGFLTGDSPGMFVPMLSGRSVYLGYTGWLWTQGQAQLIEDRKATIKRFFSTGNPQELCSQGVRWVMSDVSLTETYVESRGFNYDLAGKLEHTQETPYGEREFVRLNCELAFTESALTNP